MKITVNHINYTDEGESYTRELSLIIPDDLDIYQMMEELKRLLVMLTFSQDIVDEYFEEEQK